MNLTDLGFLSVIELTTPTKGTPNGHRLHVTKNEIDQGFKRNIFAQEYQNSLYLRR